jgi:hypothetical protein
LRLEEQGEYGIMDDKYKEIRRDRRRNGNKWETECGKFINFWMETIKLKQREKKIKGIFF